MKCDVTVSNTKENNACDYSIRHTHTQRDTHNIHNSMLLKDEMSHKYLS